LSPPASGLDWDNLQLNQDATTELQNEEQIAINPTNPDNMVAVWRDFRLGFRQVGWAYTFDGGVTWTEGGLIPEPNYPWQSDPGITVDKNGNFYAIVLSLVSTSQPNGLFVLKSTDGGVSWGPPLPVVDQVPGVFEDKEFMACDRTDTQHEGNLYVTWARFGSSSTQIVFRRSTDDGVSWSGTLGISGTSAGVQFPIPVVGRQGEVYVAWCRQSTFASIRLKVSTDGGVTFGPGLAIASTAGMFFTLNGGVDAYSAPAMDADITAGPFSGRVYTAFMDERDGLGDFDIWITSSDDQGASWTTPVRVNDDPLDNGRDQFHPWLTVDNAGIVTVVWLDRRHDPANLTYHCVLASSFDGGVSWSANHQVSTVPSNPLFAGPARIPAGTALGDAIRRVPEYPQVRAGLLGEYIGVVSWDGIPTPIWTDIRNQNQDVFVAHLVSGSGVDPLAPGAVHLVVAPNPLRLGQGARVSAGVEAASRLRVYDLAGRLVRELTGTSPTADGVRFRWDGKGQDGRFVAGGVYFLRLGTPSGPLATKVVVVE
jgi:hypothetical protein